MRTALYDWKDRSLNLIENLEWGVHSSHCQEISNDLVCHERKASNCSIQLILKRFRSAFSTSQAPYPPSALPRHQAFRLFDLPFEVREKIFLFVLARHPLIHIIRHKGPPRRLRAVRCQDTDPFGKPPSLHHCWTEHLYYVNHRNYPHVFGDPKEEGKITGEGNVGFLGLLLTCGQIYAECIQLLFSNNVFDLLHIDALSLLANPTYLPASHFHLIRHLRLSLHPSADFYHSQPRHPPSANDLKIAYKPDKISASISSLLGPGHDPQVAANPYRHSDWTIIWDIIPRMRALSTIELRLNALCGPACDFPSKCNLLRPLIKVAWRDAPGGFGLPPLSKFDVLVKWNEERFHEILCTLVEECNNTYRIEKLPFRLLAEERLAWGCKVPWPA